MLSGAEIDETDAATSFNHRYPQDVIFGFHGAQKYNYRMTSKDDVLLKCASYSEEPEEPEKPKGV